MKKKIIPILALIGFAILGIIFIKGYTDELAKILEVNLKYAIILFILTILISLFRGHMFKLLMENQGIKLKFKEWWGLQILTAFWNALTPFKGGLPAKAIYLKKKYRFPYTSSISLSGITYLTNFLGYGLIGFIFSFFLPVTIKAKYILLIFFIALFLCSAFMLFFFPLPIKMNIGVLKYIIRSINEIKSIRTNYLLFSKIMINFLIRTLICTSLLYFAFHAFDFRLSLYACIIINIFLGLTTIISITPMNLGFQEGVVIVSSQLLGAGALAGTFVAILIRAVSLAWIFISMPIFGYILFKNFK